MVVSELEDSRLPLGGLMSTRFRVVLSLAFALLGVLSCLAYANAVRDEANKLRSDALARFGGEIAQLVVAEETLEVGDVVTERNVRMRDWVADLAPAEAIVSLDDALGREISVPVSKGVPLTALNFRDASELAEVPAGHVAVSVPVTDRLGISRGVTRGSRVSAYAVSQSAPHLIANDIEVLSELGSSLGYASSQQLTIAVLPQDVPTVLGASASGELRLVIPADDVEILGDTTSAAPQEVDADEGGELQ